MLRLARISNNGRFTAEIGVLQRKMTSCALAQNAIDYQQRTYNTSRQQAFSKIAQNPRTALLLDDCAGSHVQ
jgi:hypothetical protein